MSALPLSLLIVVPLLGLTSGWLARVAVGTPRQALFQRVFLACLGLVGLSAVGALLLGPGPCLISGTTLALMTLTATIDFGPARRAAA